MARIRSVHPGLFTDEAFAHLSDAAQILWIGIWTECDDQGVFEWKPGTLRMRLRSAKDGSVEPLLAELEAADCIRSYEHEGRKFGVVRNFKAWQRPKKPNSVYFMPPQLRTYVNSKPGSSELDDDEGPTVPPKSEKSPQMDDEGGRREKDIVVSHTRDLDAALREAAGWQSDPSPNLFVTGPIEALIGAGADLDADVLPTIRALAPRCTGRKNWKFFVAAIAQARDDRIAASKIVNGASHATGSRNPQPQRRSTVDTILETLSGGIGEGDAPAGEPRAGDGLHAADQPG